MNHPRSIAIVGGGIAGLATGFYMRERLRALGLRGDVRVYEKESWPGGKIQSGKVAGCLVEGGPDSIMTQRPEGIQLCRDLGIDDRLVPVAPINPAFSILRNGKPQPFPDGFRLAVPLSFGALMRTDALSFGGKLRLARERFVRRRRDLDADESLASFIRRRCGSEVLDALAGPVLGGIFSCDPESLSMQAALPHLLAMEQKYGSLTKGMRAMAKELCEDDGPPPAFVSFPEGMGELVEALMATLEESVEVESVVRSIEVPEDTDGLTLTFDDGREDVMADAVILALPAFAAAALVRDMHPALALRLDEMPYTSSATVSLGFRQTELPSPWAFKGYGLIVPPSEGSKMTACTVFTKKFPDRAPPDFAIIRVFIGGPGRDNDVDDAPDDAAMINIACDELHKHLGIHTKPMFSRVAPWPRGSPQYTVGHLDRVSELERLAAEVPGLFLTGSAFRGNAIPGCIREAKTVAEEVIGGER